MNCSGTGYTKMGFAGNSDPSYCIPTAIATRSGPAGGGRPAVGNKPSFLTGGASNNNVAAKRGTEDLDFFIGDEALAAASGPGELRRLRSCCRAHKLRLWHTISSQAWNDHRLGMFVMVQMRQA
ncbi:hypothetical protein MRB53_037172 [Persea americana]|nr:hypothetical protein MRB53_037172 [Persea americana]